VFLLSSWRLLFALSVACQAADDSQAEADDDEGCGYADNDEDGEGEESEEEGCEGLPDDGAVYIALVHRRCEVCKESSEDHGESQPRTS
jgi:hypothetical protein